MAERPTVLIVISSLAAGGAEKVASTVANGLADAGYRVIVLTFEPAPTDHFHLGNHVLRVRIPLLWPTRGPVNRIISGIRRWRMLRRAICAARPSCVISFIETSNIRTLWSCLGTGIPVIVSERIDPRRHPIPRAWNWLRRNLYPHAAAVVVQTESVAVWARALVSPGKVRVIPNPVQISCNKSPRPAGLVEGNIVIAMGRLTEQKGFPLLIEAFARSGITSSGWRLVILGEGPDRAVLEAQVRSLGLQESVALVGVVAEPEPWLRHSDLFVLASLYEGFPNALLEAMACGLAVIAFDCPSGPSEIIRHGQTGLLLPAADVDALTKALRGLAGDAEHRRTLSAAAIADVRARFAPSAIIKMWEQVILDVAVVRGSLG